MAVRAARQGQLSRPAQRSNEVYRMIAPIGGIDTRVALSEGSAKNCVYCYNMIPFEYGMQIRKGYREWQLDVTEGASEGIHTMIPFDGVEEQGAEDRLFAVTNEGIFDVTDAGGTPVLKIAFTNQDPEVGYGVYSHYIGNNEKDVLFYADNLNGLFSYDADTDTWAQAAGITGPVVENVRWVVSHKQRLWLIEENSTKAWYLPIGSTSGEATEFFFGSKFRHGGNLHGLFNWTVDGGDGVDDFLVAVSRSGDVLPYKGTDPSSVNSWALAGTYYIGKIPKGPFFGTEHGGELYLLSTYGVSSMNDLLQGVDTTLASDIGSPNSVTAKIAALLRTRMQDTIDDIGWSVRMIPSEGGMLITTPTAPSQRHIQFFYNVAVQGWGLLRDVPVNSFDTWEGQVVVGDFDNRVLYMDQTADEIKLVKPPPPELDGVPIEFSVLTSYQSLGSAGVYKNVSLVRPDFLSAGEPTYNISVRFDYDIKEIPIETTTPVGAVGEWDVAEWDRAVWGTATQENYNSLRGGWDVGRMVAIAIVGKSRNRTRLLGFDLIYQAGGPLL